MSDHPPSAAEEADRQERRRDAVAALPLLGTFLLVSPILNAAASVGHIFGIPAAVAFVFFVWFTLVILTALLARQLPPADRDG